MLHCLAIPNTIMNYLEAAFIPSSYYHEEHTENMKSILYQITRKNQRKKSGKASKAVRRQRNGGHCSPYEIDS